jgi:hypothetical protein
MKFAVAALLGYVAAEQIAVVEKISFNQEALDNAASFGQYTAHELSDEAKLNAKKNREAIVDAYSTYIVEEHVGFSKNFGPLVKFQVEMIDALSPAGKCDQKKATECVNAW